MRLVSFRTDEGLRIGLADGGTVVDLNAVDRRLPTDLGALLRGGFDLALLAAVADRANGRHVLPLAGIDIDLPLTTPGKIFCLGLNYLQHVKEGPFEVPDYPTIFMRGLSSLVAHGKPIVRPLISDKLDYEAELALVIGKRTRHATKADALKSVAGYACFNDGTLRDYQKRTVQWTVGKNFDSTGGFGPFFVTPDALPPGAIGLKIESRLNGEIMQSENTANMMFPVAETIATISAAITLEPGDMIVMGTPSGVGYARKPPVFMKPGDTCEIEIEGLGVLSNPIVAEAAALAVAAEWAS
jgi:acylpyruvate hydrolase